MLLAGCSNPIAQGGGLLSRFGDTISAWETTGYEDYTASYAARRTANDDFRVVAVTVAGGEVVSCESEGDWADLWIDPVDLCADPAVDPNRFVLGLLGSVEEDHLAVSIHADGHFLEQLTYDDPNREGEERLITVLRLDAVPTRLVFWRESGPASYDIVYSMQNLNGMGGGPGDGIFEVTVRDGKVVECVAKLNRAPASQTECRPAVSDPIGVLFHRLAQFNADHTAVTYHPDWRFPTEIFYDDPNSIDEETLIRVHRFELLEGG